LGALLILIAAIVLAACRTVPESVPESDPQTGAGTVPATSPGAPAEETPGPAGETIQTHTSLFDAVQAGDMQTARDLIDRGEDPNAHQTDEDGFTPLILAVVGGNPDMAGLLIQMGANPDEPDSMARTALMFAAFRGDVECLEILVAGGASVDFRGGGEWTALMVAAYAGQAVAVQSLLDAGADAYLSDSGGWTAVDLARSEQHDDVLAVLNEHFGSREITDETWREGADRIVVGRIDLDLATIDPDVVLSDWEREFYGSLDYEKEELDEMLQYRAVESVLWYLFANKPAEMQFMGITTEDWYEKWAHYRMRMTERAASAGYPADSLDACFGPFEPSPGGDMALLPVGAYLASYGPHAAWIVVCKWEYCNYTDENGLPEHSSLGHIRGWAVDAETLEVVGFFTCD